jgi:enolase
MMGKHRIGDILAREILNNQGIPVLEVDVLSEDGFLGRASASFGVSAGIHEVAIQRDGGARLGGMGVLGPIHMVRKEILPALKGMDPFDQRAIDRVLVDLDGRPDKSRLGGNTICSVSMAVAKLAARISNLPLYRHLGGAMCNNVPRPLFNLINGGPYSTSGADFQEFHVAPLAPTFAEAVCVGVEIAMRLPDVIRKRHGPAAYQPGHLGGVAAPVSDPRKILDTLLAAVEEAGYSDKVLLSIDCATSHLFDHDKGVYALSFGVLTTAEVISYFQELVREYPLFMLEDPLHEDDFEGFAALNTVVKTLICGDDLFVNNLERLRRGAASGAAGAMIFKPNMVGSVTEALDAAEFAVSKGMLVIPSMRAAASPGDPTTDLGVAGGARLMKVGAPKTGERTRQTNKLIRMSESLGDFAAMIGEEEMRAWLER